MPRSEKCTITSAALDISSSWARRAFSIMTRPSAASGISRATFFRDLRRKCPTPRFRDFPQPPNKSSSDISADRGTPFKDPDRRTGGSNERDQYQPPGRHVAAATLSSLADLLVSLGDD